MIVTQTFLWDGGEGGGGGGGYDGYKKATLFINLHPASTMIIYLTYSPYTSLITRLANRVGGSKTNRVYVHIGKV